MGLDLHWVPQTCNRTSGYVKMHKNLNKHANSDNKNNIIFQELDTFLTI